VFIINIMLTVTIFRNIVFNSAQDTRQHLNMQKVKPAIEKIHTDTAHAMTLGVSAITLARAQAETGQT